MDDERITRTVRVKPTAVISMPLSLKRWLEETAERQGRSQAAVAIEALEQYRDRIDSATERELAAVS